jgi:hypothetical protein
VIGGGLRDVFNGPAFDFGASLALAETSALHCSRKDSNSGFVSSIIRDIVKL